MMSNSLTFLLVSELGVDLDSFTSFSLGYSRILTNPYRGGQLSDVKYNQGSISISAILRF